MLQFLRHQSKFIMIVLATIIVVAFTFWGGQTQGGPSTADTVLTALGRDYSLIDVQRLQRTFRLGYELGLLGTRNYHPQEVMGLKFQYGSRDTGGALMVAEAPVDYALNLIVLRDAFEKYGIRPTDEEVQQTFRSLGRFQVNGQFDRDSALAFERNLGSSGLKLSDIYEVIRDSIGLQKLESLVASNLVANPKVATETYTAAYQTIKAASIPFALEDFKKTAKVTDEEIQKYFDENKESYKTPLKRAVSYVIMEKPNTEGKNAEDTFKADTEYNTKLQRLADALIVPKANFEAEVKKEGLEVKTLPAFAEEAPPEAFKDEADLVSAIFFNNPVTHPISDPIEVKKGKGHVIFSVTNTETPVPQELKDVKDKVREVLVAQKAAEAMQKAANDAKKKLEEAIKGGKTFDVAAKEAALTPTTLPEFSPREPIADQTEGPEIAREASITPPGAFTKPIETSTGIILVYVLSKELRKSDDSAMFKRNMTASVDGRAQANLFRAWFEKRYQEANIQPDTLLRFALDR
jgi:hypothetical protein